MTQNDSVRCLVLPLGNSRLLLPSAVVVEVLYQQVMQPMPVGVSNWLLGEIDCPMAAHLPVISFEGICGIDTPPVPSRVNVVVIHSLNTHLGLSFYGIQVHAAPSAQLVDRATLSLITQSCNDSRFIACHVLINQSDYLVPELDEITLLLSKVSALQLEH